MNKTRIGYHKQTVSIDSARYDQTLKHCAVCGARVESLRGQWRIAEPHGRLVEVLGKHGLQSQPCPGSLTLVAEARKPKMMS